MLKRILIFFKIRGKTLPKIKPKNRANFVSLQFLFCNFYISYLCLFHEQIQYAFIYFKSLASPDFQPFFLMFTSLKMKIFRDFPFKYFPFVSGFSTH